MITIYVDGGGGDDPKYGFYVNETGKSVFERCSNTSNDKIPEYLALKSALEWLEAESAYGQEIVIYSDCETLVCHMNQKCGINNDDIRDLVRAMLPMVKKFSSLEIKWVPREENLAGKLLGS